MTLYSYVLVHDTGFAPNPFFGYCTLACCKPDTRRKADPGDWIVGLTPKAQGNRIVYFMQVGKCMTFAEYWEDQRFRQKRPAWGKDVQMRCGDNIYEPLPGGGFRQLRSMHREGDAEDPKTKTRDLRCENVLISTKFEYFGSKPKDLPPELSALAVGRGHKCRFSEDVKNAFLKFAGKAKSGVHAPPCRWPEGDASWKPLACGRS